MALIRSLKFSADSSMSMRPLLDCESLYDELMELAASRFSSGIFAFRSSSLCWFASMSACTSFRCLVAAL